MKIIRNYSPTPTASSASVDPTCHRAQKAYCGGTMEMIHKVVEWARSSKFPTTVLFAIVPILLFAGFAIASIDTEVTACVNNKNGSVRIINFLGGDCTKTETKIVWNKQGPTGPQGQQGEKGDTGTAGTSNLTIIGGGGEFPCSNCTVFFPALSTLMAAANEQDAAQTLPASGTASMFYFHIKHNSTPNLTFTVMKNGTATAVSCSISGDSSATTCNDTTDSVAFSAGDTISIRSVGTGIIETMRWTAQYQGDGIAGPLGASLKNSDFYFVETPVMTVPRGTGLTTGVGCTSTNDIAIAGGPEFLTGGDMNWRTVSSRPDTSKYSWDVSVFLQTTTQDAQGTLVVRAMCLRLP
ncbi:MAG TPA: hypothetical protein VJG64_04440 [Candidatus Paceibacterota bacterium]